MGNILNSNARYLAEKCASLGLDMYYQVTVGDNYDRMMAVVKTALDRSDIVIVTGGLGPTEDDLTKEATAAHLGKSLIQNTEGYKKLLAYFETTHRKCQKQSATVSNHRRWGSFYQIVQGLL